MTQSHDSLRQTGLLARLGLLEMPISAKTVVTPPARLWYKSAVARGLSERDAPAKRPKRVRSPDSTPLRGRRDWPSRQQRKGEVINE
jgi:hypothetical protein